MRCLEKDEVGKVLSELHAGEAGGNFGGDTTAHKVLRARYCWPTLFKYSHASCRKCIICQKVVGRVKKVAFPLQPVTVDSPFQQWGLDIISPIIPSSSQQHKYIITTTDYFTRWSEAAPLKVVNTNQVVSFLNSNIITRFVLAFRSHSWIASRRRARSPSDLMSRFVLKGDQTEESSERQHISSKTRPGMHEGVRS
jgi:hypothetical protein